MPSSAAPLSRESAPPCALPPCPAAAEVRAAYEHPRLSSRPLAPTARSTVLWVHRNASHLCSRSSSSSPPCSAAERRAWKYGSRSCRSRPSRTSGARRAAASAGASSPLESASSARALSPASSASLSRERESPSSRRARTAPCRAVPPGCSHGVGSVTGTPVERSRAAERVDGSQRRQHALELFAVCAPDQPAGSVNARLKQLELLAVAVEHAALLEEAARHLRQVDERAAAAVEPFEKVKLGPRELPPLPVRVEQRSVPVPLVERLEPQLWSHAEHLRVAVPHPLLRPLPRLLRHPQELRHAVVIGARRAAVSCGVNCSGRSCCCHRRRGNGNGDGDVAVARARRHSCSRGEQRRR
mmetsp:Transcript_47148/g.152264  ORF Transcript_47148/g.152264 Transcript_47148/m.152264 type:complete len:357 (-) Transcript_47148:44-1114(-)